MPAEVALSPAGRRAITPHMYATGWKLIAAGCTVTQVMHGAGLTRAQLRWLMQEGDPAADMPPYARAILEQVAELRGRSQQAAKDLGLAAVDALTRQTNIAKWAQTIVLMLLQEVAGEIGRNMQTPPGQRKGLHMVAPSKLVSEALRVLTPLADFGRVAAAFRQTFDSGHMGQDDPVSMLPREARLDFGNDSLIPAALQMLQGDRVGSGGDPLTDLLPESTTWTEAEAEHFAATGERPERDFHG